MIATAEYPHRLASFNIGDNRWIDDHSIRVPWLNFLTSQAIPEETDVVDCAKPKFSDDDDCSLLSMEDSYIVLDVPQPLLTVKMNFGKINEDDHHVEYDQLAQSMINEIPSKNQAVAQLLEPYGNVVQVSSDTLHCTARKTDGQRSDIKPVATDYQSRPILSTLTVYDPLLRTSQLKSNSNQIHPAKKMITRAFVRGPNSQSPTSRIEADLKPHKMKISADCSKKSAVHRLIQRPVRLMHQLSSETNEPSLLRINYLDGRPALVNAHAEYSSPLKDSSYRQRFFNHLQRLLKPISTEQAKKRTTFEHLNQKKTFNG